MLCPPPPPPTPCLTSDWPPHEGTGWSACWGHGLGSVCYRPRSLDQLMIHRWCNHYRLLPSQAQGDAADSCQSLPPQNYCQNLFQSLFFPTVLVVEKLKYNFKGTIALENWSVWRRLLLGRHLVYNLLVRSFSRAETIFGSKERDATSAECLLDPLTPLGALYHNLFPWSLTLSGHRVIYRVGRTGSTVRHRVIYGVGQWTG